MDDTDVVEVQTWLQHAGLKRIGKDTVHDAIRVRASENAFHPVRDYLASLRWDEVGRLDHWLTTRLGVEANPYTQAVGRMFLISMVARVLAPRLQDRSHADARRPAGRAQIDRVRNSWRQMVFGQSARRDRR